MKTALFQTYINMTSYNREINKLLKYWHNLYNLSKFQITAIFK